MSTLENIEHRRAQHYSEIFRSSGISLVIISTGVFLLNINLLLSGIAFSLAAVILGCGFFSSWRNCSCKRELLEKSTFDKAIRIPGILLVILIAITLLDSVHSGLKATIGELLLAGIGISIFRSGYQLK